MFFLLPAYLSCVLIRSGSPPLGVYRNNHYICRRIALETSDNSENSEYSETSEHSEKKKTNNSSHNSLR